MQTRFLKSAIFLVGGVALSAVVGCGPDSAALSDRDGMRNAQDEHGDASAHPDDETGGDAGASADGGSELPADPDGAGGAGGSGDPGGSQGGGSGEEEKPATPMPLASAIRLDKIVLYQAVAVPLMSGGQAVQQRTVPVVKGRDAMLRVHVAPTTGFAPRELAVEVEFEGSNAPKTLRQLKSVRAASADGDLGSTFNFEIPGAHMTPDLAFSVAIRETKGEGADGSSDAAWPSSGKMRIGTDDSHGNLEIVIVPVRYQGDRSGRLPDTSAAQIETFRKRFHATYPAPDTNIVVREPVTFSESFSRNGTGWSKLLNQVCAARQQDRPAGNAYYYGLVMPATSFSSYCGGSCVTGLGNVVQRPSDEYGRCAIGLGFADDRSLNTALHEIGHAMGRNHAPCGNPSGVDRGYPYSGASIGSLGFDFETKQLREPSKFKDFLSYCDPQWVSDYTYRALFERISYVNGAMSFLADKAAPTTFRVAMLDGEGKVEWGESVELSSPPSGEEHELAVLDDEGNAAGTLKGYFYPYSHLPGGTMLVPEPRGKALRAIEIPTNGHSQVLRF